jgi:predicted MFS family arabinose efflux permease
MGKGVGFERSVGAQILPGLPAVISRRGDLTRFLFMTNSPNTHAAGGRDTWRLAALLAAPFMAQADATIANVATPSIHADLHASGAALELVIGGYMIAFAVLLITGARLGRSYGYRRIYVLGMALFSAASLAGGLAPDPVALICARGLQGAGAALMFPQALTGIQLGYQGEGRARAIGLYAIALSSGAVAGQIFGGLLVSANIAGSSWRPIFLVNVPIGVIAMLGAARVLPADEHGASGRMDVAGVVALSSSLLLIVLPLLLGRSEGWPLWTWMSLAAGLGMFALFLLAQRRAGASGGVPLVNLSILARRQVLCALLTLLVATGTYYALLFTLAQYLQQGVGRSAFVSGLTLVPWVAAFGLAGQLVRRAPARVRPIMPAAGCLLLAAAYAVIAMLSFARVHDEAALLPVLATGGFGLGVQFSSVLGQLTGAVPDDYAADISGVSSTTAQIGGVLGVSAIGTVYLGVAQPGFHAAAHAFALTALTLAGLAVLAAALSIISVRQPPRARVGRLVEEHAH